jgi:hypothetical protein
MLMELFDLSIFLGTASMAYRIVLSEPTLNGIHAMVTQEVEQNQDQVLHDMSSTSTMRGDDNHVPEQAPKSYQQQQERPSSGLKRKAQDAPDAQTPAKRRASGKVSTRTKLCQYVSVHLSPS